MYTYDFLTVKQAQRLYYQGTSLNYAGALLHATVQKGYAQQDVLPRKEQFGSAPALFFLSAKGSKHLHTLGYPPPHRRYTRSEITGLSYLFWRHTLAVNDFIMAAHRLESDAPGYALAAFQHDRELRENPISIQGDGSHKRIAVVPDAWLDFRLPVSPGQTVARQIALHIEVDRGSMPVNAMKRKLRALLRYIDGPYQAHFHTQSVTICFATTAGARRRDLLRSWCEQVLTEKQAERDAPFFYFTALPPQRGSIDLDLNPSELFLRPVWSVPFHAAFQIVLSP
jgi:hypothetical protein